VVSVSQSTRLALPANLKDAAIFVTGRRISPPLTVRLRVPKQSSILRPASPWNRPLAMSIELKQLGFQTRMGISRASQPLKADLRFEYGVEGGELGTVESGVVF
jgi:hypothetical protein